MIPKRVLIQVESRITDGADDPADRDKETRRSEAHEKIREDKTRTKEQSIEGQMLSSGLLCRYLSTSQEEI